MYLGIRTCRLLICFILGFLVLFIMRRTTGKAGGPSGLPPNSHAFLPTRSVFSDHAAKFLLLWDSFADLHLEDGSRMFHQFRCQERRCSFTRDRSLLADSAVVLYHMRETISPDQLPQRPPGLQKWVFAMKEPPVYSQFNANSFNGFFDWTMTYRGDSDIPWPYGGFSRRPKPRTLPDYFTAKCGSPGNATKPSECRANSVTWIVSRCKSDTKREDFVAQLQQHIDVAIYGRCGPLKCSRGSGNDSCQHRMKDYHFYLAFENSFCPDYVTEKLYKVLAVEDRPSIPLVMGLANYSQVAPPGSVINVRDFKTPYDLSVFLKRVMSDRKLYNSFHAWRKDYKVSVWGTPRAICSLCAKAHAMSEGDGASPRRDLSVFWDKNSCHE